MKALPPEVLSYILLFASPDPTESFGYDDLVLYRNSVSAVDSFWRAVALSTALLWSTVQVHFRLERRTSRPDLLLSLTSHRLESILCTLNIALERSLQAALDIELRLGETGHPNSFSNVEIAAVMNSVQPHLAHCRRLLVSSHVPPFPPIRCPLPMLETLELVIADQGFHDEESPSLLHQPLSLPRLHRVRLHGYHDNGLSLQALFHVVIPTQLTEVCLYESMVDDVSNIMAFVAQCLQLERLELWISNGRDDMVITSVGAPPILLERLEYLGTDVADLYKHLSTPNLRRLYARHTVPTYLDHLASFFRLKTLLWDVYTIYEQPYPPTLWNIDEIVVDFVPLAMKILTALLGTLSSHDGSPNDSSSGTPATLSPPLLRFMFTWDDFMHNDDTLITRALDAFPLLSMELSEPYGSHKHDMPTRYGSRLTLVPSQLMPALTWGLS